MELKVGSVWFNEDMLVFVLRMYILSDTSIYIFTYIYCKLICLFYIYKKTVYVDSEFVCDGVHSEPLGRGNFSGNLERPRNG